ncbi:helix-turn-helix domain-containing protein [Nonlabens ulvanivorans]|uniref:helix-turn-helix domain-containing protein n=1 Tax=Nonlabens ulvanivorans TaxID=906888 RepID=UPI003265F3C8
MNLIITTEEELEDLVKTSVKFALEEYFTEQKKRRPIEKFITVQDAAVRLKVSTLTVRNYIKRGLIKANKVGNRILIEVASIDKALEEVKSLRYKR